jgi:hypothetical protein
MSEPQSKTRYRERTRHHTAPQAPHQYPYIKWVVALITGFIFSLALMVLITAQIIEQSGAGVDLVFNSFFLYTGGLVLLQNASSSIIMFVLATGYYFIFFTLIGLIIGVIVEWLVKMIARSS